MIKYDVLIFLSTCQFVTVASAYPCSKCKDRHTHTHTLSLSLSRTRESVSMSGEMYVTCHKICLPLQLPFTREDLVVFFFFFFADLF